MPEHGFGKGTIRSGGPPSKSIVRKFAQAISKVHGVIRVHIQKPEGSKGNWTDNQIIFEFGHVLTHYPDEYPTHADFIGKIQSIEISGHGITNLE